MLEIFGTLFPELVPFHRQGDAGLRLLSDVLLRGSRHEIYSEQSTEEQPEAALLPGFPRIVPLIVKEFNVSEGVKDHCSSKLS